MFPKKMFRGGIQFKFVSGFIINLVYDLLKNIVICCQPTRRNNKGMATYTGFPALTAVGRYLLCVVIGSFDCIRER